MNTLLHDAQIEVMHQRTLRLNTTREVKQ